MWPQIIGCRNGGAYPFSPGEDGIQTCRQAGFAGAAVFTFAFEGKWKTSDLNVYFNNGDVCLANSPGTSGYLLGCPTGSPYTTTPEPSTWVLMATGLIAIGVTAHRKRRHRKGD